jgi:4-hydroxy-tetrahydrodipicolinate reductase
MGRAAIRAIAREPDLRLVAALGRQHAIGQDAGEVASAGHLGVPIGTDLAVALSTGADVLVEFAPGRPAVEHAAEAIAAGVRPIVGSTGIGPADIEHLETLAAQRRVGAVVAPNFALGAVLMMEFSRMAARFMPHVEVIELHHDRKRDAPSGTATRTAHLIAGAREASPIPPIQEDEMVAGARGGLIEGVRVHSVRLPGLSAHQEVIFGGMGQTLRIRHDSIGEEAFMPGLLLAVRRVGDLCGLVYGLEHLLGLR